LANLGNENSVFLCVKVLLVVLPLQRLCCLARSGQCQDCVKKPKVMLATTTCCDRAAKSSAATHWSTRTRYTKNRSVSRSSRCQTPDCTSWLSMVTTRQQWLQFKNLLLITDIIAVMTLLHFSNVSFQPIHVSHLLDTSM